MRRRPAQDTVSDTGAACQSGRLLGRIQQPRRARGQWPVRCPAGGLRQGVEGRGRRPVHLSGPEANAHQAATHQQAGGMSNDLIFYHFSRSKVERGDFRHFLGLHAPDKLPTGRRLRETMSHWLQAG